MGYRIMSSSNNNKDVVIGLNETKLGIAAPKWMAELMIRTIGFRAAEKALSLGQTFTPEEALQIGLVDELIQQNNNNNKDDDDDDFILKKAYEQALYWSNIPNQARIASKLNIRQKFINNNEFFNQEEDLDYFCKFILQDSVQENIGKYIQSLKKQQKRRE